MVKKKLVSNIIYQIINYNYCVKPKTSPFINNMFQIAEKIVDIFKDAEDGFGVTECSSLACLSNPCSNGATCHSKEEEWSCSCKNGYSYPNEKNIK